MDDEPRGQRPDHRSDYPYIHPERLPDAEPLAIDAEDVEEFLDHYDHDHREVEGDAQAP